MKDKDKVREEWTGGLKKNSLEKCNLDEVVMLGETGATSEPGAVATGQMLFRRFADPRFFKLTLWPVATAPGSDAASPGYIYFLCQAVNCRHLRCKQRKCL